MKYPRLTTGHTARDMIEVFGGYNHNLRIRDGEFYDMENLTSSHYPVLSPRVKRGVYAEPNTPSGMIAKDGLCYVDGTDFVCDGIRTDMGLSSEEKTLISMGAYVIIMPDKKYINTADISDHGDMEATVVTSSMVSITLCKMDGENYASDMTVGSEEPKNPNNLDLWLDTSSEPHGLKQFSSVNRMWVSIATTYVKITSEGIGIPFEIGDGITLSGIVNEKLSHLNSTMVIRAKGEDYIVVTGMIETTATQEEPITLTRKMPNMDFIIESDNRLWGCRYGTDISGNVVNEIYASKLGDFKNWNCFSGISTDSYAATVGTDGKFTGAVSHMGHPIFFKEACMHKVYGNFPANYQIQTTPCRGVQSGCDKSLAIVNEVLYYKSRSAVCAYDGSLPMEISSALGDVSYRHAVAGSLGNKYYISMMDTSEEYQLFVYDTGKGLWHREDNTHALAFCSCKGELFYIDADDKKIKTVLGSYATDTETVKWMAETGILGTELPDKKYISRVDIRLSLPFESKIRFFIDYDSLDAWEHIHTMEGIGTRSFTIPIRPKRCDHFRLRMEGEGDAKIYSLCKTIEEGSEV